MLYFVMNPNARSGHIKEIWKEIEQELRIQKKVYYCYRTKRKKDAVRIARKLTQGKNRRKFVILGGDGTLNEFLNGMRRTKGIELGYLPLGSGNDFARGMKISRDYRKELQKILKENKKRKIDYGLVDFPDGRRRRFFVSSGIGYDAKICFEADHSRWKKVLNQCGMGKLIYLLIGLRGLMRAETYRGSLVIDRKEVLYGDHFLFVSFHNLPCEGGGFFFCPNADAGDGYLDVCVAKGISKWKIPWVIPLAALGKHVGQKGVYQFRGKEMVIRCRPEQHVHTDGETKKVEKRIRVRVSEKQIIFMN